MKSTFPGKQGITNTYTEQQLNNITGWTGLTLLVLFIEVLTCLSSRGLIFPTDVSQACPTNGTIVIKIICQTFPTNSGKRSVCSLKFEWTNEFWKHSVCFSSAAFNVEHYVRTYLDILIYLSGSCFLLALWIWIICTYGSGDIRDKECSQSISYN